GINRGLDLRSTGVGCPSFEICVATVVRPPEHASGKATNCRARISMARKRQVEIHALQDLVVAGVRSQHLEVTSADSEAQIGVALMNSVFHCPQSRFYIADGQCRH